MEMVIRLSITKSLFPVQRVAIIAAIWAAAIFFPTFVVVGKYCPFFWGGGGGGVIVCFFVSKMKKRSLQSHLFELTGHYTGNIIIFMDSLIENHLFSVRSAPEFSGGSRIWKKVCVCVGGGGG